jgi:acetyl-CoA C-acetyltransferase
VSIVGIGQTPVDEHWDISLRVLGAEAVLRALEDAGLDAPQALYVGNMLSGQLSAQENVGALIADHAGLRGIEAAKIEAACASGGMALRLAYVAVAGGMCDVAVACGVEKMTDAQADDVTAALASAADAVYEGEHGVSFVALNALLMRRYMHEYGYRREDFGNFAITAHRNAVANPNAIYRRAITAEAFAAARMIAEPVSLLDSAGIADGAAAVVLTSSEFARAHGLKAVRIAGSAVGTDAVACTTARPALFAGRLSLGAACLRPGGLRATGFGLVRTARRFYHHVGPFVGGQRLAARGRGVRLAMDEEIGLQGRLPIATMGGLKARGHPVGATGIYQVVDAVTQLRGEAGANTRSPAAASAWSRTSAAAAPP